MSKTEIRNQLKQRGRSAVMLTVKPGCRTAAHLARLRRCFEPSASHDRMLYLENLGLAYGQVGRKGWEELEQQTAALDLVGAAPLLQPITGLGSSADVAAAPELSWGLEKTGAPALWAKGLTGRGVLVGHLDTGIDGTHPALRNAIEAFAEFDSTGHLVKDASVEDSSDHGTHTAGIIAGRPGNGRSIGMAPGCKLVSAAVIEGGDPAARLLAGVNWALGFPIKVLNLSLGFPGYCSHYVQVLRTIRSKGVLPVFSAGNFGAGTSCSPANYPQAMSVGAIDQESSVDDSSSSERLKRQRDPQIPDLVMPGIDIISANAGGGFRADSGTSMAAPHASGLAALLWEAFPDATVEQVERAIYQSCARSESQTEDRAGRGLPDGVQALDFLIESRGRPSRAAAKVKRSKG